MTAPDRAAAVQIAARALGYETHSRSGAARAVVDALDAATLLRRPDEAAYVAALEAVAEAFGELFILDVGRSAQGRAWVKVDREGFDRVRAARDAVPAAETGTGTGTGSGIPDAATHGTWGACPPLEDLIDTGE